MPDSYGASRVERADTLTLSQAADFLRVSPAALKAAAVLCQVPGYRHRGRWYFSRAALRVCMSTSQPCGHRTKPREG